jgi:hypothetical protein
MDEVSHISQPRPIFGTNDPCIFIFDQIQLIANEEKDRAFLGAILPDTQSVSFDMHSKAKHTWTLVIQLTTFLNEVSDVTSYIMTTPSAFRKYCFVILRNL